MQNTLFLFFLSPSGISYSVLDEFNIDSYLFERAASVTDDLSHLRVLFLLCCPDVSHNISYSPFPREHVQDRKEMPQLWGNSQDLRCN